MSIRLQPLARARLRSLGSRGDAWIHALPTILDQLARRWRLNIGRGLPGGSAAYVARAITHDGQPRVLKVGLPTPTGADDAPTLDAPLAHEVATLRAADGRGYARLFDYDEDRRALLLESLGPTVARDGKSPEQQLDSLAATLIQAWMVPPHRVAPAPPGGGARRRHDQIRQLDAWLQHRGSRVVIDRALAVAADLAVTANAGADVATHGDAHPGNLLAVSNPRDDAPTGYLFVDPDGVRGERAADLGVALREWGLRDHDPTDRLDRYADRLSRLTSVSARRIRQWAYLERVATGLYVINLGSSRLGEQFLASAGRIRL